MLRYSSPKSAALLLKRVAAAPLLMHGSVGSGANLARCLASSGGAGAGGNGAYKAVVFDMGGVLIPGPAVVFREFESRNRLAEGELLRTILSGGDSGAWHRLETGQLPLEEFSVAFSREIANRAGRPIDAAGMLEAMDLAEPLPEMLDAVRACRSSGFRTALLTNNWMNREGASLMPLDARLFDVIVESCKVGCRKPDERIYKILLERLGLPASSVVFLDDIGQNLKAAKALGIKTIKVTSSQQAIRDLESVIGVSLQQTAASSPQVPHPPGTVEVSERLRLDADRLRSYLAKLFPSESAAELTVRGFSHGQSNPTYYIRLGQRELVLRKKPPGKLLPSAHAIEREFRVMSALRQRGVPLPELFDLCEDSSVLGTPFYVMEYLSGQVFTDVRLPDLKPDQRRQVYSEMIRVLALIHSVDPDSTNLSDYGKRERYLARNIERWRGQYEASVGGDAQPIPEMTDLHKWLMAHLPEGPEPSGVVHGDFRLDNLVFDRDKLQVIGILDWELSTLGHPRTDLATCLLAHRLDPEWSDKFLVPSLQPLPDGVPTEAELIEDYCKRLGLSGGVPDIDFYHAFVMFRFAAILQGVYKRALDGQSSSAKAKIVGSFARDVARLGWTVAQRSGLPSQPSHSFSSSASATSGMPVSLSDLRPEVRQLHAKIRAFVRDRILPLESELNSHYESQSKWTVHPSIERLKSEAKNQGLWNLFLPVESDPNRLYSPGLTNLEYAFLCEEMGWSVYASEVFNCSAPDTGNMEVLVRYGTEEQKRRWLDPLLAGSIRSCFAMTEPAVASSDATNIEASICRSPDGSHYVVNGHKWWISGALHPNCKVAIFMGKTDTSAAAHKQQTMLLVPMDSPGVTVVRPLHVFGFVDAPAGHAEVRFDNVIVPAENVLLGEGRGFEIAQGRLGPGRVHHCMRLIGHCERAIELACQRAVSRVAFGKPLAAQGSVQQSIAWSRAQLEAARLLVLKTAHLMDTVGNKKAMKEIALIKVMTPRVATEIIDRAIQIHGGAGLSLDLPLSVLYTWSRVLRLADGPDEVHLRSVAKLELAPHVAASSSVRSSKL
ncbi:hypothetical protein BOX15_Mlig024520g1 [Macrostomum lignano]|uniref:Acyl-CoA dehydrogenase family member 10 n=1 Tax=Macrostomum lignano TaxID=282301 RepID=A0A267DJD1_9PLAT|nr:hypothetical protein BOX15_Mlig024520g1 [Macrostomum lignano]